MVIDKDIVMVNLSVVSREDAICQMTRQAQRVGRLDNCHEFIESVERREALVSTAMGRGVAIPHGKSGTVNESFLIFAKLSQPIQWNENTDSDVDLVFMIGISDQNNSDQHLKILSQIARKLMDDEFIDDIRLSQDSEEILEIIGNISLA